MCRRVKQGTVEIDMETIMDETSDGSMVEVNSINTLNQAVRGLGGEKVSIMEELKDFRTKIHAVNWEIECLEFKADEVRARTRTQKSHHNFFDLHTCARTHAHRRIQAHDLDDYCCTKRQVADNTRFYQLLWVTKGLQTTIKGGDDGRKAAENATLEKQMQHSKKLHELKVRPPPSTTQETQRLRSRCSISMNCTKGTLSSVHNTGNTTLQGQIRIVATHITLCSVPNVETDEFVKGKSHTDLGVRPHASYFFPECVLIVVYI